MAKGYPPFCFCNEDFEKVTKGVRLSGFTGAGRRRPLQRRTDLALGVVAEAVLHAHFHEHLDADAG
jgi:hypothetical protein